jgi:hypothetical protein
VLGTWCTRDARLAAATTALVTFAILFAGVINGYFAADPAAMLTFIFAVTIPAPFSGVPARLAGWAFAAVAGVGAQLLLWPSRPDTALRGDAAQAGLALADLAEVTFARDQQPAPGRTQAARTAVCALRRRFLAAPHRPSGPTARRAALGLVVDELDWLPSLLTAPAQVPAADWAEPPLRASPKALCGAAPVSGPRSRAAVPAFIGIRRLSGRGHD